MTITRGQMQRQLYNRGGIMDAVPREGYFVGKLAKSIKKGVKKDKNVQLIGFGTFSVTKRAARDGINPQTQEKIRIKASKAVKFKAGAGLKAVL